MKSKLFVIFFNSEYFETETANGVPKTVEDEFKLY
jgi:hypothetical protein